MSPERILHWADRVQAAVTSASKTPRLDAWKRELAALNAAKGKP